MDTLITLSLPDEIATCLAPGGDLPRIALEGLALEGYRARTLSSSQVRRMLAFRTRLEVHAFLKSHGIPLHYSARDLEHDRQAGDALTLPPAP